MTETCPSCGGPTGVGCGPGHRDYREPDDTGPVCLAMDLTRNHCIYYARQLTDSAYQRDMCCCYGHHRIWHADCAREQLARCVTRVREVWPVEHLDWLTPYVELAHGPEIPEHQHVPETRQEALL